MAIFRKKKAEMRAQFRITLPKRHQRRQWHQRGKNRNLARGTRAEQDAEDFANKLGTVLRRGVRRTG